MTGTYRGLRAPSLEELGERVAEGLDVEPWIDGYNTECTGVDMLGA